jgi:hypothetical protein
MGIGENKRQDRKEGRRDQGIKSLHFRSIRERDSGQGEMARFKPSFHRKGSGACSLGVIYRVALIPPQ